MHWFGFPPDLRPPAAEDDMAEEPVPVGERCYRCDRPFVDGDRGFRLMSGEAVHQSCLLDDVLGPDWRTKYPEIAEASPQPGGGG